MSVRSKVTDTLFAVVRLGLWPDSASVEPDDIRLTPDEWASVIDEAQRQGVLGIFSEGMKCLPEECLPQPEQRIRLLVESDALQKRAAHVEATCEALLARFAEVGLHPLVQKGPAIAKHYAKPLLRKSGDIDLYFSQEEFAYARRLAEKGFSDDAPEQTVEPEPDGSVCYRWNDVTIEHHNRFFDSKAQFEGVDFSSDEAMMLVMVTHILKHALGPGIGLKQLCDYAVATERILPGCDINALEGYLRKAGLSRWLGVLDAFVQECLGVPHDHLLSTAIGIKLRSGEPLLDIVLQGGEFGHYNPFRRLMASPARRKLNTLRFFVQRLPFALKTAPAEWRHTVSLLLKGNLTH